MQWKDRYLCADDGFEGSDRGLFEGSVITLAEGTTENHKTAGNLFNIKLEPFPPNTDLERYRYINSLVS
jgi:hypothetical protein